MRLLDRLWVCVLRRTGLLESIAYIDWMADTFPKVERT